MVAGRALNRRFCPFVDVTANQTLPVNRFFSFPDGPLLELVKIGLETIQVVLFDLSDCSEVRGDDREAFLVCDFGVSLISLNAFVSFFVDGDLKIIFPSSGEKKKEPARKQKGPAFRKVKPQL